MKKESFVRGVYTEIRRMIKLQPKRCVTSLVVCFISAALSTGYTIFFKELVEYISSVTGQNAWPVHLPGYFFGFAVVLLLNDVFNAVLNYQMDKQRMYLQGSLKTTLFAKVQQIPVLEFEKSEVLDALNKANMGMESCVSFLVYAEIILGNSVFYMLLITGYLVSIHPLLSLVVFGVLMPSVISYFLKNRLRDEAEEQSAVLRRRMTYADSAICNREFFKETRHLRVKDYFKERFKEAVDAYIAVRTKEAKRRYYISLGIDLSYFLGFMLTIGLICFLVYRREISIGSVAAVIVTVNSLYDRLNELFGYHIAGMADTYNGLYNFHVILQMEVPGKSNVLSEDFDTLNLIDVDFRYPKTEREALKKINLQIKAGETICIVGENGSGKSTLSKILLGLYPPTKGRIVLNDKLLDESSLNQLREKASAVFQDYNRYALNLEENIFIGDIEQLNKVSVEEKLQEQGLKKLATQLPEGAKTMLSKEFGGTDVSQGQWQRISIARGILRNAEFIVLDEPTAAIDPLLELELLNSLLSNKIYATKIIITHRIGIARQASRILVMKNGMLVENGTHEELMQNNTEYARLFRSQSQWYQ